VDELKTAELAAPFSFTKGLRPLRIKARPWIWAHPFGTLPFDLHTDPGQRNPINDQAIEEWMIRHLIRLMQANAAPPEQFARLGLFDR